jgi:hypothetical protein
MAALVAGGCGGALKPVPHALTVNGRSRAALMAELAQARAQWLSEMLASAKSGDRSARFPTPSRAMLVRRLQLADARYGFTVASVRMLRPLQAAPVIVIRTDQTRVMARSLPAIISLFDPRHPTNADPSGYAYEGYFLVVETRAGNPYIATFNHWRALHIGGGEWAASDSLFPFAHG